MTGQSRAVRVGDEGRRGRERAGEEKADICKLVLSCALYVAMKIHETVLEAERSARRNYRWRCGLDGC